MPSKLKYCTKKQSALPKYNVMKVLDVDLDVEQISKELASFIKSSIDPTYKDQILKEHLYDINGYMEDPDQSSDLPESLKDEMNVLVDTANQQDCAFIRIVSHTTIQTDF